MAALQVGWIGSETGATPTPLAHAYPMSLG